MCDCGLAHVWRSEDNLRCYSAFHLAWDRSFALHHCICQDNWPMSCCLSCYRSVDTHCHIRLPLHLPPILFQRYRHTLLHEGSRWALGIWTQVLTLERQALLPEHLSSLSISLLIRFIDLSLMLLFWTRERMKWGLGTAWTPTTTLITIPAFTQCVVCLALVPKLREI